MYFTLNHGHPRVSMKCVCNVVAVRRITVKRKSRLVGRFGAILGGDVQAEKVALDRCRRQAEQVAFSYTFYRGGKERVPSLLVAVVAMTELS
jgi:hypothetical protein